MTSRITGDMTAAQVVIVMAEGNPGALSVCVETLKRGGEIDPRGFMGGLGAILLMDTFRIYGPRIWMLHSDVCRGDLVFTLAVLRACQLGTLPRAELDHAIDNRGDGIDVEFLLARVRERLPEFGVTRKTEART